MLTPPPPPPAGEDYSPSATLIPFDRPIPPLRIPIPAGRQDDPSAGPFLLAFPSPEAFLSALRTSQSRIFHQCECGARIGCAISASAKCSTPWWRSLFGSPPDPREREDCEERETAACVAASRERCVRFVKDKSLPAFRDARVALGGGKAAAWRASEWIFWASMGEDSGLWSLAGNGQMGKWVSADLEGGATNCRGSAILGSLSNVE